MKYTIQGKNKVIRFETDYFVSVTKVNGRTGTTYLNIEKDNDERIIEHKYKASDLVVCFIDNRAHIVISSDEDFIPELMEDLKKAGIKVEKK